MTIFEISSKSKAALSKLTLKDLQALARLAEFSTIEYTKGILIEKLLIKIAANGR